MKDNQIVAVALVVAEKEVLAVLRAILAPIFARDLDGRCLGVFIPRVADVVGWKVAIVTICVMKLLSAEKIFTADSLTL